MTATLQIQLFGGLRVALDGVPIRDFYSNKAPALLAYLAMTRRAPSRDALAALFWGEMSDADAKTNLRQCLANLRKLVEPHLVITRDVVEFNLDVPYVLDVEQFESKLRADSLGEAVALYTGDLLDGVFVRDAPGFEEWAIAQRARLRELALQALHTLTRQHAARGEYARGMDCATRLIALDPWREETHRELMLMLARSGQRSVALQQYEVCKRILAQEMGVEPSAETTALYERIRAAGESPRHHLPPQVTSFVGRAQELAHVESLLLRRDCRLITLLGVGGMGKTRLALEAAERALKIGAFLNGVFFVPLGGVDSPDLLAPAMAQACGLAFSDQSDPRTQLVNFLREKEILIVLDNLEHLLDAALWLNQVLNQAPNVTLLVTSRERLNLRSEWLVAIEGLDYPHSGDVTSAQSYSAVRLFVERARQVRADFEPTVALQECIARVCQSVEGMPLAIELASAWAHTYTCDEIAGEIERGFAFLATAARDVPERQRSLRAVFEHSWRLLSPNEREAFHRLGVFHGGFTSDAAECVANATHGILSALVNKSFLRHTASGRYDMHELLRQYAQEKLAASGDGGQTRLRHGEYYAEFLHQREAHLKGNRQKRALDEIGLEIENARAAWQWAVASHGAPNLAVIARCMEALFVYWEMRASFEEGERAFAEAAAAFGEASQAPERLERAACITLANLIARQSWFCFRLARYEQANEWVQRSLEILRRLEAWQDLAYPLLFAGACAFGRGDLAECQQLFLESCSVYRRLGDAWGIAGVLNNLGQVATAAGDYDQAGRFIQESLHIARRADIRHLIGHILNNLGGLRLATGDHAGARHALQESLSIARDSDERYLVASALNNLGAIALALDDPAEAERHYQEAENLWRVMGDRWALANTLNGLAEALLDSNETREARQQFRRALTLAVGIGATSVALNSVQGMALVLSRDGEIGRALELAAFVVHHTSSEQATKNKAQRLISGLSARLPVAVAATAQQKGAGLAMQDVIAAF